MQCRLERTERPYISIFSRGHAHHSPHLATQPGQAGATYSSHVLNGDKNPTGPAYVSLRTLSRSRPLTPTKRSNERIRYQIYIFRFQLFFFRGIPPNLRCFRQPGRLSSKDEPLVAVSLLVQTVGIAPANHGTTSVTLVEVPPYLGHGASAKTQWVRERGRRHDGKQSAEGLSERGKQQNGRHARTGMTERVQGLKQRDRHIRKKKRKKKAHTGCRLENTTCRQA